MSILNCITSKTPTLSVSMYTLLENDWLVILTFNLLTVSAVTFTICNLLPFKGWLFGLLKRFVSDYSVLPSLSVIVIMA